MATQGGLGHLLWWKVGDVDLSHDQLEQALAGTGITLPARPLPHDVYRRVTGDAYSRYDVPDDPDVAVYDRDVLEISLVPIESKSDKMLTRHIVGTLKTPRGEPKVVRKCGDVVFYRPPRGKNSKARMRVTTAPPLQEWGGPVAQFADRLRAEYEAGVKGALDGQAIRRLVRTHLARVRALYLDGPYFVQDLGVAETPLRALFATLGEDSYLHSVPLPDLDRHRKFLTRGLERAVKKGDEVDETIWKLLDA